jgi:hypothetical protein
MSAVNFIRDPSNGLDVVAGLIDGILNALTLAAGRLVHTGGEGATLSLALRVSVAAGATTMFVFFIAHYAQLRLDLIRHERELNFTEHGKLAATRLGHRVFLESLLKAMLASGFSVVGALFPLVLCVIALLACRVCFDLGSAQDLARSARRLIDLRSGADWLERERINDLLKATRSATPGDYIRSPRRSGISKSATHGTRPQRPAL